jgi:hypothetical protein
MDGNTIKWYTWFDKQLNLKFHAPDAYIQLHVGYYLFNWV